MPASIKEVAAHAGVSISTVSNVLNRPQTVAQATLERVNAAVPAVSQIARAPGLSQRASSWAKPWQTATITMPLPALSAIHNGNDQPPLNH